MNSASLIVSVGDRAIAGRASRAPARSCRGERTRTSDPAVPGRVRCHFATPRRRGSPGARTLTSPVKGRMHYHRARDPSCPGIELNDHLSVLRLQRSACTAQAAWARAIAHACRDRVIVVDYSLVICPVLAASLSSRCERRARGTVDSRAMQSAAVQGGRNRTLIARSRISRPTVRRPLIVFVSPERFELSPHRLKVECAAITPRAQGGCRGRAFELRLHHVGALGIEPSWCRCTRGLQPRPEPRRSARPKMTEATEDFSRAAPDRFGYSAWSMRLEPSLRRSWAAARA